MKEILIEKAKAARLKAYAPYSNFFVGASVLTIKNKVYVGCNIENSSYPLTCCAERVALFQAISAGERNIKAMAVVGDTEEPISPCGACRQVMSEFLSSDTPIYLANTSGNVIELTIKDLLPFAFNDDQLYNK